MPSHETQVPATTSAVRTFLSEERERFVRDLRAIRGLVEQRIGKLPVYKIYSRGDHQYGEELKHARKVRLKFNQYFVERNKAAGSLWTVPDIIGFTIVVTYPSDITSICRILDELVDRKHLVTAPLGIAAVAGSTSAADRLREADAEQRAKALIETRFGRPIVTDGYFACHYNVRTKGVGAQRPMCEIQIKTVLHDAWGAKTHDLTYKPSGRTSQELIDSFNLLGDTLAKIDQQSDLVRRSIERTSHVREAKKRHIQIAVIASAARSTAQESPELIGLIEQIETFDEDAGADAIEGPLNRLLELFDDQPQFVCVAMCLLSICTKDGATFEQAQETIETWYESASEPLERVFVRSIAALASYSAGDVSGAIEAAEQAIELIERIDSKALDDGDHPKLARLANSILTSLAYYHADRVGSHDGKLGRSRELAPEYLARSIPYRQQIGLLPVGLDSTDEEIEAALRHPDLGFAAFSTLDNEAFVRIQTANTEDQLRAVRRRLEFLHKERPSKWSSTASLLFNYHEYCARARLAELEAG